MARTDIPNPLTPAVFHILLALASEDRHGYAIMKQVSQDSQGTVTMGPGTLYGTLNRMLDMGLVKESQRRRDPTSDDQRRIYYAMTGLGKNALIRELKRYRHLVELTTLSKLLPVALPYGR